MAKNLWYPFFSAEGRQHICYAIRGVWNRGWIELFGRSMCSLDDKLINEESIARGSDRMLIKESV